ncbi:FUN14 domain-containing protein 1-like isoform X1 [Argopecten irradians]|uniref:FUN14 domain-containing protein 1-like isoform X1 n=1 Tax=Argopecten irradians TaxID=31199 RepID=UPI00371A4E19
MADENEPFEVLDVEAIRRGNTWIQKMLGDISKQSAAKQVVIGGASGWVSGYLFVKVGKIAAMTLGTTILLVQIAQYKGYIQINWKKVQKEMNMAKKQMSKEISKKYPHYSENIQTFFKQNVFLATGFAGGFLVGMAF